MSMGSKSERCKVTISEGLSVACPASMACAQSLSRVNGALSFCLADKMWMGDH
jgi:hypothetical protein